MLQSAEGLIRGPRPPAASQTPDRIPSSRDGDESADLGRIETSVLSTYDEVDAIIDEWAALHARSGSVNPFTHPSWLLAWARRFVPGDRLCVVTVRQRDALIGVAPFYWVDFGVASLSGFRALHLLGNGACSEFTEMPGILAEACSSDLVIEAVVSLLQAVDTRWDWAKITLDPQQGWFQQEWLGTRREEACPAIAHHETAAFVIVDLPDSWEEFLSARKRNVRESIRRSVNRLDKRIGDWSVETVQAGPDIPLALAAIAEMHTARSKMTSKPNHPAIFEVEATRGFYFDAVTTMARSGNAEVSLLRCKGDVAGGMVALRAGSRVFVSVSAADPEMWDFGPGTILIAELARREIARGTKSINLSAGPNQSKLRWSEELEFSQDFMLIGPARQSHLRFRLFSQMSRLSRTARARSWNTRDDG